MPRKIDLTPKDPQAFGELAALGVNRHYVQAVVDQSRLTVPAINAYADKLFDRFWAPTAADRQTLLAAMQAYIDGWLEGHQQGYKEGAEDGTPSGTAEAPPAA